MDRSRVRSRPAIVKELEKKICNLKLWICQKLEGYSGLLPVEDVIEIDEEIRFECQRIEQQREIRSLITKEIVIILTRCDEGGPIPSASFNWGKQYAEMAPDGSNVLPFDQECVEFMKIEPEFDSSAYLDQNDGPEFQDFEDIQSPGSNRSNSSEEFNPEGSDSDYEVEKATKRSPVQRKTRSRAKRRLQSSDDEDYDPTRTDSPLEEPQFKCHLCEKEYMRNKNLKIHLEQVHNVILKKNSGRGEYHCTEEGCERVFPYQWLLRKHQSEMHSGERPRPFSCRYCDQTFYRKGDKTVHEKHSCKLNDGKELGEFPCEDVDCGKIFKTQLSAVRHYQRLHKSNYFCDICGRACASKAGLGIHREMHKTERDYKCEECGKDFKTKVTFDGHVRTVHGEKIFTCKTCNKKFSTNPKLKLHMKTHEEKQGNSEKEEDRPRPFLCRFCGKSFLRKGDVKVHELWYCKLNHERETSEFRCDEPGCGKVYTKLMSLKKHQRVHTSDHYCEICGRTCPSRAQLNDHLAIHKEERDYICDECGKSFKTLASLKSHQQRIHGEKIHFCPTCNEGFTTRRGLQGHIGTYHTEKPEKSKEEMDPNRPRPFLCHFCGQGFFRKGELKYHQKWFCKLNDRRISGEFRCPEKGCGKVFQTKPGLGRHRRYHKGSYPCDQCNKVAPTKSLLNIHKDTHKEKKDVLCPDCGQLFKSAIYVRYHQKNVHGPKRFLCHICHRAFGRPAHLNSHLETHEDLKLPCEFPNCDRVFKNRDGRRSHNLLYHRRELHKDYPLACTEEGCKERFKEEKLRQIHVQKVHIEGFVCPDCGQRFPSGRKMWSHRRVHKTREKSKKYTSI